MNTDDLIYSPICPDYEVRTDRVACRVEILPGKTCDGWYTFEQMKRFAEKGITNQNCSTRPDTCPVIAYYRNIFRP